ncbi:hypothetical protein D8Y22_22190 [Salinadaptatus halalkaliphilus]|uniref:Uncharacterized protein n=1 Tax=Salinadaptatus halalkaliphilus TaxID=2419781 RepID=A0A4V3VKR5_9EURY|nr:hypothetical protein [Salinadaptatus halalkaliphilus]THE62777.1 hypothetical protein D8Y22_22190 [Salinadaptatus halalkaliphilus]
MPERPPSPSTTPLTPTALSNTDSDALATTTQLATTLEDQFDVAVDEATLEALLLELDRRGLVEWEGVSPTGAYVWNCSESADRLADAVATSVVTLLEAWLESHDDG